jgi:hypothetical protein
MEANELETIVRNWNPETNSVNVLKDALNAYNGDVFDPETPGLDESIVHLEWAEKYYDEYAFSDWTEHFCVLTVDFEGNCLMQNEEWEVKSVSELKKLFENWIKGQGSR